MIESSLLAPLVNDLYPDWGPFPDIIGSDEMILNHFDSISSNSSDIDAFNFSDFENYSTLSDEFVSKIVGDVDLYSSFSLSGAEVENFNESSVCSYPCNLNKSNVTISKKKRSACLEAVKSWSSMSAEEKNKTLLQISDTTCRMGISNQIDVIRIIKPGQEISAEMTEFTLDVSLLNDSKLKKIKEYFKRHKRPVKSRKSSKAPRKSNSSVSRTSKKPRQKKEREFLETERNEFRRLKRKIERQSKKEEKSGLFVYEKVVKFSTLLEEDEDVNILE